jgi:hypothetical protein
VIHPKQAGKDPQIYDIKKLTLTGAGPNQPMDFRAVLTNAKPPGEIQSTGKFGPWNREDAGDTPVSGKYTFNNADLSVFNGIAGTLSSRGEYRGVLGRIEIDGETDTPDFLLKKAMNPVHLVTHFHAIVDGTDDDTYLQPVRGEFGRSVVIAQGQVAKEPGAKGKTIALDAAVQNGRLEDMLGLGVRSKKPPLSGDISFRTKIVIPPGDVDVVDKLHLDGLFTVAKARAAEPSVQSKIDMLSHRGRGITKDEGADTIASNFRGRFVLNSGVMTFRGLTFQVPGVDLSLNGTFSLDSQEMDFRGTARMDARLSQMTTGFKSLLLKAVDPFFAKEGSGTVLPIAITGAKDAPSFRLSRNADKKPPAP